MVDYFYSDKPLQAMEARDKIQGKIWNHEIDKKFVMMKTKIAKLLDNSSFSRNKTFPII